MSSVQTPYVVLARKWRPAQFSDIVGQHHIIRTLMNAIRAERIHQAYLFTGSRGIGKTSIARIFAKVIRCEHTQTSAPDSKREDVAPKGALAIDWLSSCDACASCKEIAAGTSVDVIEIDGASNNGVEAVREIRENAKYMPSSGTRKIYIIDEVHMLTTAAFNALLKILEEPPPHVIFVFATTEPHKIPATILSRCQRFDFRRVTMVQIQTRLAEVTQAEGMQAEPGALSLIARAAEGGMRDAMSLLDQVISFSGQQINAQSVRDSIGLIEGQTLLGIVDGIFARKPLEALALVEQAYNRGHDLRVLTRSLIEFLHAAVLARIGATHSTSLELAEEEWNELKKSAEQRSLEEIELIFQVLHHGLEWIARSPQPKVVLDVLIVKCATAEALIYVGDSEATGGIGGSGGNGPRAHSAAPALTPASPVHPAPRHAAPPAAESIPETAPIPVSHHRPFTPATPSPRAATAAHAIAEALEQHRPATAAVAPVVQAPLVTKAPVAGPVPTWEGFIDQVRKTRPLLASILEHAHCEGVNEAEGGLLISIPPNDAYYKDQLSSKIYNEQLLNLSKEYFGRALRIQIELRDAGESVASKRDRELKDRERTARSAAQNHPIILEARALFGGELGPIELAPAQGSEGQHVNA
jgi:DNA polymerase-3 subunit gamma/tau